jgi:hypothetical protein
MGPRFTDALDKHEAIIAENVTANLYDRHLAPCSRRRELLFAERNVIPAQAGKRKRPEKRV